MRKLVQCISYPQIGSGRQYYLCIFSSYFLISLLVQWHVCVVVNNLLWMQNKKCWQTPV